MKFSMWKLKSLAQKHNKTKIENKKEGEKLSVKKNNKKGKNVRRKNKEKKQKQRRIFFLSKEETT